jgi:hypothetical protein
MASFSATAHTLALIALLITCTAPQSCPSTFTRGGGSDQARAAAMPISRPIGMIAPVTRSLSLRPKRMPLRDCKAITPLSLPNRPQSMVCALMRSRMPPSDFGLSPLTQGFTHAPQADAAKRSSSPPVPRWFIPTFFLSAINAQPLEKVKLAAV